MAVLHLNTGNFDETIGAGLSLVDFWAAWCGPCKMVAPVIDQLADKYEGSVKVAKVNVDEEDALAERFGVMSIPTVIVFENGLEKNRLVGLAQATDYEAMLGK